MNHIPAVQEFLKTLSFVDYAAIAALIAGAAQGLRRGLSGELAHVFGLLAAFLLSLWFWEPFVSWTESHTRLGWQSARAVAFLSLLFGGLIFLMMLRHVLKKIISVVVKDEADRTGGLIAGIVRSVVVITIFFLVMNLWPNKYLNRKFGEESLIGRTILKTLPEDALPAEKDEGGGN